MKFNSKIRFKHGRIHKSGPTLELTTMVGCPLMCTFCPQKNLKSSYGKQEKYMRLKDLEIILKKLPSNMRIDFSGMSEPWANPECTNMLKSALSSGFDVAIYTTLYGITIEDAKKIKSLIEQYDAQIKILNIHLPDSNGNMLGWRYSKEWEDVYKIITTSKISCGIKTMTMDGSGKIHKDISHLTNNCEKFVGNTRAGSLNTSQIESQAHQITPRHTNKITCAFTPFYDKNVLLPNGDVVLCCMDYDLKHIIGNLLDQDYQSIFKSNELLNLIKINGTEEFSKCSICKSCNRTKEIGYKRLIPKFLRPFIKNKKNKFQNPNQQN